MSEPRTLDYRGSSPAFGRSRGAKAAGLELANKLVPVEELLPGRLLQDALRASEKFIVVASGTAATYRARASDWGEFEAWCGRGAAITFAGGVSDGGRLSRLDGDVEVAGPGAVGRADQRYRGTWPRAVRLSRVRWAHFCVDCGEFEDTVDSGQRVCTAPPCGCVLASAFR